MGTPCISAIGDGKRHELTLLDMLVAKPYIAAHSSGEIPVIHDLIFRKTDCTLYT